jgi:hypothetical protein
VSRKTARESEKSPTPDAESPRRPRRFNRERRITYTRLVGLVFCAAGFVVIGLGWNGMARVACPDCQLPYLLSGGATGIGLIIFGVGLLVMAQIRADRLRGEVHLENVLATLVRSQPSPLVPGAETSEPNGQRMVVAGPGAYHRPDCNLLKGKSGLTTLSLEDAQDSGLAPCRVCNPLEEDVPASANDTEPEASPTSARRRRSKS